jgi:hypothetical protein
MINEESKLESNPNLAQIDQLHVKQRQSVSVSVSDAANPLRLQSSGPAATTAGRTTPSNAPVSEVVCSNHNEQNKK